MSLQSFFVTGYSGGLQSNKKPFLLPDQAFHTLYNAFVWRERVKKREGLEFLGRLRRIYSTPTTLSTQASGSSYTNADILADASINVRSTEPNAEIDPFSVKVQVGAVVFTDDNGNGLLVGVPSGNSGNINYSTGELNLSFSPALGGLTNVDVTFSYFPSLPGMGILQQELSGINDQRSIWFDTKYAYFWNSNAATDSFQEFIPVVIWHGNDSDFFSGLNYRGVNPQDRAFFVTNFNNAQNGESSVDPIRYTTDSINWNTFAPLVSATQTLYQARILVAYYGRMLALNTFEGATGAGQAAAVNFYNRCRFSQRGDPLGADAWQTDIFGKGGSLDAPVNESIISAIFIKNTLVVTFEYSTWQLRYVGEYGQPFIWERVSADFGSESTFSNVLFDNHILAIGDKAIIAANGVGADRIDLDIPNQIFDFKNANNGQKRVFGIRDYQRELVFWSYPDSETQAAPNTALTYPNKVLVYNYRNKTWAIFRDSVTCFGTFNSTQNITWDNTNVFWDDEDITWDDFDSQSQFPYIVCLNQQGFASKYGYSTPDQQSLTVQDIDITVSPIRITSPKHNLQTFEIVYLTGLNFVNAAKNASLTSSLNDQTFQVIVVDEDNIDIYKWNSTTKSYESNFSFTPVNTAVYQGGGVMTLFPKLNVQTKDINIFQEKGMQIKLSYIDFLMEATPSASMTVNLFINSSPSASGNPPINPVWSRNMSTALTSGFYPPGSDYAWFRYYATLSAQYFNINITYNDDLMNNYQTHAQKWTMLAINAWCRPGGRNPF